MSSDCLKLCDTVLRFCKSFIVLISLSREESNLFCKLTTQSEKAGLGHATCTRHIVSAVSDFPRCKKGPPANAHFSFYGV